MSGLDKYFDFSKYEKEIYDRWETSGLFKAVDGVNKSQNFCIVMPPPNANESLHIGHGLPYTLSDVNARFQRQMGKNVLYIPGLDHAGFETQFVFESKLAKQGKSRFDFTREQLYQEIYDYVESNKALVLSQMRKMGLSCDWNRLAFTLDDHAVNTTKNTFIKMFKDGLVYRDERIVNYSPKYQTTFSNLEVSHIEREDNMYYLKYPVLDKNGSISSEFITVATVRPETMLADQAVAVHPSDQRYQHLVGKMVRLPITNKDIPIIADDLIDPDFGSGAVKVTPAHSEIDFAIAKKHNLPTVNILNADGTLNQNALHFAGQTVFEAREALVKELNKANLIEKVVDYKHQVACNYKDKEDIIEPIVEKQWLLRMDHFASQIMSVIRDKKIIIEPESARKILEHWLENIQDWNLSRQIVWGINIPAFYNKNNPEDFIVGTVEEAIKAYGQDGFIAETDVFDTWFSSGQWPLIVLSAQNSRDMTNFYPTQWLGTAIDIIFFWVARMILFGLYSAQDIPFQKVYFHGLVADGQGQKMSKSKGNVINPMTIIDQYGADAFRLAIISRSRAGKKQSFSQEIIISERNFLTKIWNIARFIDNSHDKVDDLGDFGLNSDADHWIADRYNNLLVTTLNYYQKDDHAMALDSIYRFVWDDLASYYVEFSKIKPNINLLRHIYFGVLTILHPVAPFITEYLWQYFYPQQELMFQRSYPGLIQAVHQDMVKDFAELIISIKKLRFISKAINDRPVIMLDGSWDDDEKDFLLKSANAKIGTDTRQHKRLLSSNSYIYVILSDQWQEDLEQARINMAQELEKQIRHISSRLNNQGYIDKAPVELIEESRAELELAQAELELIKSF